MLDGTIRNNDFQRNTALQHCCDIVSNGCNIVPTLQFVSCNITLRHIGLDSNFCSQFLVGADIMNRTIPADLNRSPRSFDAALFPVTSCELPKCKSTNPCSLFSKKPESGF